MRIALDAGALPLAPGVTDTVELAATGGEDYELWSACPGVRRVAGVTWIGEVVARSRVWSGATPRPARAPGGATSTASSAALVAPVTRFGLASSCPSGGASGSPRRQPRCRPRRSRTGCALAVAALCSPHRPWEGAMWTSTQSAAHGREPDPSSRLVTRIGYPAPSCECHRRPADNDRWGRSPHVMPRRPAVGPSQAAQTRRFAALPSRADGTRTRSTGRSDTRWSPIRPSA